MNAFAPIKSLWKTAQLRIAFHKTKEGLPRNDPFVWRPNDGNARLPEDPEDKEAFINVQGEGDAHDVQIKMHPDKLVLRRDPDDTVGWTGIIANHYEVRVRVAGAWVLVGADGSVRRQLDDDTGFTKIEADGSFRRNGGDAEINVSGDGRRLTRITEGWTHAIEGEGVVSRPRSHDW